MVEHIGDVAITRILAAEQQARAAVDGCRQSADALVDQALVHARAIGNRADHRIALIHARVDQTIEAAECRIAADRVALEQAPAIAPEDLACLPVAVDALIAEILGESKP